MSMSSNNEGPFHIVDIGAFLLSGEPQQEPINSESLLCFSALFPYEAGYNRIEKFSGLYFKVQLILFGVTFYITISIIERAG